MTELKGFLTRRGLDILQMSQLYRLLQPKWGGRGLIFTLHHVISPERRVTEPFCPNRILEVSPEFLEQTIQLVRRAGLDIVSLDEARRRILDKGKVRRFVCFTLDDGYLNNFTTALPLFEKLEVPFTVYVTTGLIDNKAILWWEHLENIIRRESWIDVVLADQQFKMSAGSTAEKYRAFESIYWFLRDLPFAAQQEAVIHLLENFNESAEGQCKDMAMNWAMVKKIANSEFGTIGAHTVNHYALSKLPPESIENEVAESKQILKEKTGLTPQHFAYPFGDAHSAGSREFTLLEKLGFMTSTTTRKGMVFREHGEYLQALPRVSLNGDYQLDRYVQLYLSGAPFALSNRFRRVNAA
jgi:peptidoglycan/xylan/chitin deacetylase (PgdA/CDA1 family)